MADYKIDLAQVKEWQMLKDIYELELLFTKAKSAIVQGGKVALTRKDVSEKRYTADQISTEEDLEKYRERVFKYL